MALEDKLVDWDGKSAEFLCEVYERTVDEEGFLDDLFALITEPNYQTAATWLLKRHLDQGHSISAQQRTAVFRSMKSLGDWQTKLHVLQCLPQLSIPRRQAEPTARFLRECLEDKNKFVRAWAYGGFHVLAQQHESFQSETDQRLRWAGEHEAPSVRARIRQVLRKKRG